MDDFQGQQQKGKRGLLYLVDTLEQQRRLLSRRLQRQSLRCPKPLALAACAAGRPLFQASAP